MPSKNGTIHVTPTSLVLVYSLVSNGCARADPGKAYNILRIYSVPTVIQACPQPDLWTLSLEHLPCLGVEELFHPKSSTN